ncbi:TraR/DksA family transcriptional regulator [Taibaiella chishuiensis]|uniref:TraR/DksA family transcriptional regulator n=2 Tax=Taibaiella chishuiensis TaxID=1434707 RepID=A0A2P8CYK3_9BACT|nr:TraR/DksA family transcriptional regulator [Taibaiella chishuiensis]
MATKKTTASKSAKKAAPAKPAAKKAAPAKKTVAAKKATPAKKSSVPAAKAAPKKSAPVKKSTPAKKAAPVTKTAPAKKAVAAKAVPAKKAAPAKKVAATPVKKTVAKAAPPKAMPVKKAAPVAVKATPEKVKPAAAAKKPETAVKTPPAKAPVAAKEPAAKLVHKKVMPKVSAAVPSARSEIIDAVRQLPRKTAPKPGVVIAHRKIEKVEKTEDSRLTMKEYNPSVRSLLDEPEQSSGPVYRYSDEELNEFKELIIKRLDNARKELAYLQGLITRKDEAGTDDTDNRFNHMEDGSGAMEREQLSQLAGRQIQFINHLEKAMIRIENKTYGICRVTGKLIDKARLRAVPHATLSIDAKKLMNK